MVFSAKGDLPEEQYETKARTSAKGDLPREISEAANAKGDLPRRTINKYCQRRFAQQIR